MVKCNFLKNKLKTFEPIRTNKKKKKGSEPKGTAHLTNLCVHEK